MLQIWSAVLETIRTLADFGVFKVKPGIYREFFEKMERNFMVAHRNGHIIDVNPAFAVTLGYSREELRKTKFMRYVHPDDQGDTLLFLNKIRNGASVAGFQNRYICKDESEVRLEWYTIGNGLIYAEAVEIH